jgi:hypothetical protein
LTQRGWVKTLPASLNSASERARASAMPAKLDASLSAGRGWSAAGLRAGLRLRANIAAVAHDRDRKRGRDSMKARCTDMGGLESATSCESGATAG